MIELPPEEYWEIDEGAFETVFELTTGKPKDATNTFFLRRSKNLDKPALWQILGTQMNAYFRTYEEAKAFCKRRGWL